MTKITVFSNKGTKLKEVEPGFTKAEVNMTAITQAVRVYENHLHPSLSKVKTRGDVNISTRKIYRQKGTGNARHGAKSAPIFVGGGIAHGPKGLKRVVTLSKSIKKLALKSALALKTKEKALFVVDGLSSIKKTKDAFKLLASLKKEAGIKTDARATVVLKEANVNLAFRNIPNTFIYPVNSLNALRVVNGGIIVFETDALEYLNDGSKKSEVGSKKKEKAIVEHKSSKVAAEKIVAKKKVESKKPVKPDKKTKKVGKK